ncbi:MAG TPA: sulfatase-like hydrolase/transferase, partial [Planctomycetota bacterium]|nr:sulfatase-like hydrolase/transferase [Planctomycetota bacterium]
AVPLGIRAARDEQGAFEYVTSRREVVAEVGLAGYHAHDAARVLEDVVLGRAAVPAAERERAISLALARARPGHPPAPGALRGAAAGRSAILLVCESLAAFPVGLEVGGQRVTPNLDALAGECLRFDRFFEQTHTATTADAEHLLLQSLHPLDWGAVPTRFEANDFDALPEVLAARGYATLSFCGAAGDFWNMRRIHERYGIARSRFLGELDGERIGLGLSDRAFFPQVARVLAATPDPFFAYVLTLTNHHPYAIPERERTLRLEPWLADSLTGGYLQSVHFFDAALGAFVADLRASGVLDRAVLVLVGDHQPWLERPPELARLLGFDPADAERHRLAERRVPLLVRLPGGAHAGPRATLGGQIDVAPTILALLGIERSAMPAALGLDLTAGLDRLVAFRDGPPLGGSAADARAEVAASDAIIRANLVPEIRARAALLGPEPRPVRLVGHRGDPARAPEDTVPAIASGIAAGADLCEVDVWLTRDGAPVIVHGPEFAGNEGRGLVGELTLDEVRRLDVGAWKGAAFRGTRPPTLAEAVAAARGRGGLYLDLQCPGLGAHVARAVSETAATLDGIALAAWDAGALADVRAQLPGARIVWCGDLPAGAGAPEMRRLA